MSAFSIVRLCCESACAVVALVQCCVHVVCVVLLFGIRGSFYSSKSRCGLCAVFSNNIWLLQPCSPQIVLAVAGVQCSVDYSCVDLWEWGFDTFGRFLHG